MKPVLVQILAIDLLALFDRLESLRQDSPEARQECGHSRRKISLTRGAAQAEGQGRRQGLLTHLG